MANNAERPGSRANFSHNPKAEQVNRPVGARAIGATRAGQVDRGYAAAQFPPAAEKLLTGTKAIIGARIREAREGTGMEQATRLQAARRAFTLQSRRLEQPGRDDWTTSQLTSELMAKAVLFSPFASEAEEKGDKRRLAEFNDMLTDCATCIPPSAGRVFVPMMKSEIANFSRFTESKPHIIADNNLEIMMAGLAPEVGAVRALRTDPTLSVETPGVDQDLQGIDLTVTRDNLIVHMDLKLHNPFMKKLEDMAGYGRITPQEREDAVQYGYTFTGNSRGDRKPKYVVDAGRFGKIDGFDYSADGQQEVIDTAHDILNYHYGVS